MLEFQPKKLISAKNAIKKVHVSTGTVIPMQKEDLNQLVRRLAAMQQDKVSTYALTLTKQEIFGLCQYAPNNYLHVDIENVYEAILTRADQHSFWYLYQQWTRNYQSEECNEFFLELLALKPECAQVLKKYRIDLDVFLSWIDRENIAIEVGRCCLPITSPDDSFEQHLEGFGIYENSRLFKDCQYYYYTYCDQAAYLQLGEAKLIQQVKLYGRKPEDLKLFLVNFLQVMDRKLLEQYLNLCRVIHPYTGDADSSKFHTFFKDVKPSIVLLYKIWLNILKVQEVFGSDERSVFWKEYAAYGTFKYSAYSGAFVMEFQQMSIVEFKGRANGPAYFYEKEYFKQKVSYHITRETNQKLRQILYHETNYEEKMIHNLGWQDKFRLVLRRYKIGDMDLGRIYPWMRKKESTSFVLPNTGTNAAIPLQIDEKQQRHSLYQKIESPEVIITAPADELTLVNAGPGTGKTYTVIERLAHLAEKEEINLQDVLVLCYSRNAVQVIRKRLEDKIEKRELQEDAYQLFEGIRTFDSFATYMLADDDTSLEGLDYDARIQLFIDELSRNREALSGIQYLIIDEMQDLVGLRAQMVQEILKSLDCGWLLLGDKCQAIYDYQIEDEEEMDSKKFYDWLEHTYGAKAKCYELTKNVRQDAAIRTLTDRMRQAILRKDGEMQLQCVDDITAQQKTGLNLTNSEPSDYSGKEGILCRNNGEAAVISSYLYEKGIPHQSASESRHRVILPWYAQVFSDYYDSKIGYSAFAERMKQQKLDLIQERWDALKALEGEPIEQVLDLKMLQQKIIRGIDLPAELVPSNVDVPYVSTIHRAKGQEFNRVRLLNRDFDKESLLRDNGLEDEIKVAYVALTRAKKTIEFCQMRNYYSMKTKNGRWIGFLWSSHRRFCSNISIASEDIDPYGFVAGQTERIQNTIKKLQVGTKVELQLIDKIYWVVYEGKIIGRMTKKFTQEAWGAMNCTNHSRHLPKYLSDVYVSNIVTIISPAISDEISNDLNKSRTWLGFELSGFAKTSWKEKE